MRKRLTSARVKGEDGAQSQLDQVKAILRRVDAMPLLDTRSEDDILGYGEQAEAVLFQRPSERAVPEVKSRPLSPTFTSPVPYNA